MRRLSEYNINDTDTDYQAIESIVSVLEVKFDSETKDFDDHFEDEHSKKGQVELVKHVADIILKVEFILGED